MTNMDVMLRLFPQGHVGRCGLQHVGVPFEEVFVVSEPKGRFLVNIRANPNGAEVYLFDRSSLIGNRTNKRPALITPDMEYLSAFVQAWLNQTKINHKRSPR